MKAHISKFSVLIFVLSLFITTSIHAQETPDNKSEKEFKVSEKILKTYVGTYNFDQGIAAKITLKEGKLYGEQVDSGELPMHLFAVSKTKFKLKAMGAEVEFSTNNKGEVTGLTFFQQGQEMYGTKSKD